MVKRIDIPNRTTACTSWKTFLIFLLKFEIVIGNLENQRISKNTSNHSCYKCVEPLVGYTDHPGSCKYINASSPSASDFVVDCNMNDNNDANEYECRKVVISFRSVETSLRRDCAPKGLCSWKDKTQSMINTPVSHCVYTDEYSEKMECIYCCDTSLCNRMNSIRVTNPFSIVSVSIFIYKIWRF